MAIKTANLIYFLLVKSIFNWGNKLAEAGTSESGKSEKTLDNGVIAIFFLLMTSLLIKLSFSFEIIANPDLVFFKYLAAC